MKTFTFPGKYNQNAGISIAMLVYRSVIETIFGTQRLLLNTQQVFHATIARF